MIKVRFLSDASRPATVSVAAGKSWHTSAGSLYIYGERDTTKSTSAETTLLMEFSAGSWSYVALEADPEPAIAFTKVSA